MHVLDSVVYSSRNTYLRLCSQVKLLSAYNEQHLALQHKEKLEKKET